MKISNLFSQHRIFYIRDRDMFPISNIEVRDGYIMPTPESLDINDTMTCNRLSHLERYALSNSIQMKFQLQHLEDK